MQSPDVTLLHVAGSTLLQIMDKFALRNYNASHQVTSENISKQCIGLSVLLVLKLTKTQHQNKRLLVILHVLEL